MLYYIGRGKWIWSWKNICPGLQLKQSGKESSLGCHEGPEALRRWWHPRSKPSHLTSPIQPTRDKTWPRSAASLHQGPLWQHVGWHNSWRTDQEIGTSRWDRQTVSRRVTAAKNASACLWQSDSVTVWQCDSVSSSWCPLCGYSTAAVSVNQTKEMRIWNIPNLMISTLLSCIGLAWYMLKLEALGIMKLWNATVCVN